MELPPDTILIHDTVVINEGGGTDTVYATDTVYQSETVYDTVTITETDTVETVQHHYDTTIVTVTDTVTVTQSSPDLANAYNALMYYTDPMVMEFIYAEFGLDDGWTLYSSGAQIAFAQASPGVYDIAGYIDYWTPDWSSYYPLEFQFRMSYTSGDPSDVDNWTITESTAMPGYTSGVSVSKNNSDEQRSLR